MQPTIYKCKKGETFRRVLRFKTLSGNTPIDITDWTILMDVRQKAESALIASAVITPRNQTTERGVADLVITKEMTAAAEARTYKFDMCADAAGERKFYVEGDFVIEKSITQ